MQTIKSLITAARQRVIPAVTQEVGALLVDTGNWLLGVRDPDVPPTRLHFVGNGNFKAVGFEFLRYFIDFGSLKPDERVLDIGCGIGRMALPLTSYLKQGSYDGIDIVPRGITWCRENISTRHPQFQFHLADLYNERYNRKGSQKAAEYRFPFPDAAFDFIFLTSVFTHLLRDDAAHYVDEIARLLRPGGRVLGTWFLLTDESRQLMRAGKSAIPFAHRLGDGDDVMVANREVPENAIAYDQTVVRAMHERVGLTVGRIERGSWCGRTDHVSFQDMVIATRKGAAV